MNKYERGGVIVFCLLLAIASFFGGMAFGAISITKSAFKGLDHVDGIEINVDLNESKMVEAMMPYIKESDKCPKEE